MRNDKSWFRAGVLIAGLGAAAFWVYALYYLIANTSPTGGGMELVAIFPLTIILVVLTLPALILARTGTNLLFAAALAAVSILANFFLWRQLLIDLAPG